MGRDNANYAGGRNLVGRRALLVPRRAPVMYVHEDGAPIAEAPLRINSGAACPWAFGAAGWGRRDLHQACRHRLPACQAHRL